MDRLKIDCLNDWVAVLQRQADALERSIHRIGYAPRRRALVYDRDRVIGQILAAEAQIVELERAEVAA